jgi:DNA-binding CsgD family transcriptional regulator
MASQSDWKDVAGHEGRAPERRQGARRASDRRNATVGALGEWVLNRQRQPVFLVDERLTPIFSNRAARESLERVEWSRLGEREPVILDSDLGQKVKSALARRPEARAPTTLRLSSARRTLEVTPLQVSHSASSVYAIVLGQSAEVTVSAGQLVKWFRLTKTQARVAVLIYEGGNQVSVGERLGVSVNTVKTHMKEIFKKVGVRSQRGLVRKVGEWGARG